MDRQLRENGNDWLIKVFSDNAGAVRINADSLFVWKVETHNSPSAIDPYGGAITGILGNNRDPLATGIGGGSVAALLPLVARDLLHGGAQTYGIMLGNL